MNPRVRKILFILILGSVSTSMLLGVHSVTAPVIERYATAKRKAGILNAAGINHDRKNLEETFRDRLREVKTDGLVYYIDPKDCRIFEFEGRGLWGMIEGVIALGPDLKTIKGVRIIAQEETPGLGGRITEETFLCQFKNKKVSPGLVLVSRRKASAANEVDAITGATMTSRALVDAMNKSVADFREKTGR